VIRLGVVGCGRIAGRFVAEAAFVDGCAVESVYNPRPESARRFAQTHGLPCACADYQEFLGQVDAVYIASPHDTHASYARAALLAGKHVLCEKPMVLTRQEAQELFRLARERGLILLEALKTAYCPGFQQLVSCAKSGRIGQIVSVDAAFTKLVPPTCRERTDTRTGGSMTELASYPLLAIFQLLGTQYGQLRFSSLRDANGVDLFTRMDLFYPGAVATGRVGLGVKTEGELVISGTKGYLYVPAPWWKTTYFELRREDPEDREGHTCAFAGDGLRYELQVFLNCIAQDRLPPDERDISLALAGALERYRAGADTLTL
jgi:predicted dehydrogenase